VRRGTRRLGRIRATGASRRPRHRRNPGRRPHTGRRPTRLRRLRRLAKMRLCRSRTWRSARRCPGSGAGRPGSEVTPSAEPFRLSMPLAHDASHSLTARTSRDPSRRAIPSSMGPGQIRPSPGHRTDSAGHIVLRSGRSCSWCELWPTSTPRNASTARSTARSTPPSTVRPNVPSTTPSPARSRAPGRASSRMTP